jgi:hypothetical protein
VAHNESFRQIWDRFEKGLGTIHHFMHHAADVMEGFSHDFLYPMADQFNTVHTRLTEYAPYFDGCIRAIDGTHILVTVDESLRLDYMNRNGETTMNVCVMVDLHGHFTFVGVGMVGSAHDSAVLDRC